MKKIKIIINNPLYLITIVVAFLVITSSVGYAFFFETLTINGTTSTVEYYGGTKLPTEPILLDTENNRYHTADNVQYKVSFTSESWENDTIYITYTKYLGMITSVNNKTVFKIAFTNPTVLDYTDGEVTAEITENTGGMLKDVSATISKTTLKPGESCEVTLNFNTKITWRENTEAAKVTVSYNLQGERKYLYLIVKYIAD